MAFHRSFPPLVSFALPSAGGAASVRHSILFLVLGFIMHWFPECTTV